MSKASKTKSKFFCFLVYESPQTNIHTDILSDSKVIRRKKSKFILRSKFSCSRVFLLSMFYWCYNNRYWYAFARL